MVPRTDDKRVLFAIPWHDRVVVGTTDTAIEEAALEPRPQDEEIDFLLRTAARYLDAGPAARQTSSACSSASARWCGRQRAARPRSSRAITRSTSQRGGLLTIAGGKWTTYRRMAEDVVDHVGHPGRSTAPPLHDRGRCTDPRLPRRRLVAGSSGRVRQRRAGRARPGRHGPDACGPPCTRVSPISVPRSYGRLARRWHCASKTFSRAGRAHCYSMPGPPSRRPPRPPDLLARTLGRDETWAAAEVEAFTALARAYVLA